MSLGLANSLIQLSICCWDEMLKFFWIYLISFLTTKITAEKTYIAAFSVCKLKSLHPSVNANCSINNPNEISVFFELNRDYPKSFLSGSLRVIRKNQQPFTVYQTKMKNWCRLADEPIPIYPFIRILTENSPEKNKIPWDCPITKGLYFMKNFSVLYVGNVIPMPEVNYEMRMTFYNEKETPVSTILIVGNTSLVRKRQ